MVPFPSVITWLITSASSWSRGKAPACDIATRAADGAVNAGVAVVSLDQGLVSTVPVP